MPAGTAPPDPWKDGTAVYLDWLAEAIDERRDDPHAIVVLLRSEADRLEALQRELGQ